MEVGLVAPIDYLQYCSTDLHLCYAVFLSNPDYYRFYRRKAHSKGSQVLLDYSPRLPRSLTSSTDLLYWHERVQPQFLILPSVDYSCDKTLNLTRSFLGNIPGDTRTVGVLQGSDLGTLEECYSSFKDSVSMVALPSPLEKIASRQEIVRDLDIKMDYLYLEVYADPSTEIPSINSIGICTSFPSRLAQDLRELKDFKPTPPPLDFMLPRERLTEKLVKANMDEYLSIVQEQLSESTRSQ